MRHRGNSALLCSLLKKKAVVSAFNRCFKAALIFLGILRFTHQLGSTRQFCGVHDLRIRRPEHHVEPFVIGLSANPAVIELVVALGRSNERQSTFAV